MGTNTRTQKVGERAQELIAQFPDHGSRSLGIILYNEFKDHYKSLDSARARIRYYRGQLGEKNRGKQKTIEPVTTERAAPAPSLPEPRVELGMEGWKPYTLRARRILVLSDVHIPYFDRTALQLAIDKGKEHGVDCVLLNGDFMDFYGVSKHETNPLERDFPGERDMGLHVLDYLRETFKGAQIIWKVGNHEERWTRWMWHKAPEVYGLTDFRLENIMRLNKFNVRLVGEMRPIRVGKLNILHGHEYKYGFTNPVNPARGIFLRAKVPTFVGHLHQSSEHTETDLNGKIVTCWSSGCLCGLRPRYSPLNKWGLGFGIIDTTGADDFTVHNYRIWRGAIL